MQIGGTGKSAGERRIDRKKYKHLVYKEKDNPIRKIHYKAVDEKGNEKFFHSARELSDFFGYNEDYMIRAVRRGRKFFGWTIRRYKWFEDLQNKQEE